MAAIVGVKPMPGFTGPKLLWLKRHEPDNRRRVETILSPKDYLRLALCGDRGSDMSDAAGTWMLDEAARAWSDEAIAACGAERSCAPLLFEGSAAVGKIRPGVADDFGLPHGVLIAAGGGDAAVGALGLGALGRARRSFRSERRCSSSSQQTAISARRTGSSTVPPTPFPAAGW